MQCKVSVPNFLQIDAVVQAADISKLFSFSRKRRHASISQTVFESSCIFLYKRESNVPNFEEICLLVQAAVAAKNSLHVQSPLTTNTPSCNPFVKCCAYFLENVKLVCQIFADRYCSLNCSYIQTQFCQQPLTTCQHSTNTF